MSKEKLTRLKAELQNVRTKQLDVKAQLMTIESQVMENSDSIEAKKIAILQLEKLHNASSE